MARGGVGCVCQHVVGLVVGVSLSLSGIASAASFNVSPASVADDYTGQITFTIAGVTPGQTVLVEKYADLNGNGVVNLGVDLLVESFQVTDGQALSIDGVRDTNVPGDEDSASGQIRTVLNFPIQSEVNAAAGNFLYRISPVPASGGFAAVTTPFVVTQPSFPQKVTGHVTSNGTAVPAAFVILIGAGGNGPTAIALTDSNGKFTLNAAPGTYALIALKGGFVFDSGAAPQVTIGADATATQDLALSAADRTISGRLTDSGTGAGIPGVQATGQPENDDKAPSTLVLTDTAGNFTLPVSSASSRWKIKFSNKNAAMLGYLDPQSEKVDISAGNVSGLTPQLTKVDALIYGSLKDTGTHPLQGIQFGASNNATQNGGNDNFGLTDTNGNYVVGVTDGNWNIGPSSDDPGLVGYLVSSQNVAVAAGQALEVDFVAQAPCAHLRGHVLDDASAPVGNVSVLACPQDQGGGSCPSATTGSDGSFDIEVSAGGWNVFLDSSTAAQQSLISSQLSVTVTCGHDQNNLTLPVLHATAHITGVVTGGGNPISNVGVYANTTIDGTDYSVNGSTDGSGNYLLPLVGGTWQVSLDCNALSSRGLLCPGNQSVTVASGQTLQVDFVVPAPCAHLRGHVLDNVSAPVGNVMVLACLPGGGSCPSTTTGADGSFDISVDAGMWNLFLEATSAAQQGLVTSQLSVTVTTCGHDQNNLTLPVLHATAHITGGVKDGSNNPVPNLGVYANATINGIDYNLGGLTDGSGSYALPVAAGTWQIGLDCNGLNSRGLLCPSSQMVTISNQNAVVNFSVSTINPTPPTATTSATVTPTPTITPTPIPCVGNCDGTGTVTVDDLVKGVNILLDAQPLTTCPRFDLDGSTTVTVDELVKAVNSLLGHCSAG